MGVDAVAKLGTFVDNVFGSAIKNGLGLIGDKLAYEGLLSANCGHEQAHKNL